MVEKQTRQILGKELKMLEYFSEQLAKKKVAALQLALVLLSWQALWEVTTF